MIENDSQNNSMPNWLLSIILFIMLYFIYSSTFLTDYLMRDEWEFVGAGDWYELAPMVETFFLRSGRALFAVFQKIVLEFAGTDAARIQIVRFVNFTFFAFVSIMLLRFLEMRTKYVWLAFFTILFFFSQLPFQVLMGYSFELICGSLPSISFSLLAFYLHFFAFDKSRLPKYLQSFIVFILLMFAMQSTQTYAYFSFIPLVYLALSDWENNRSKIIQFLIISFASFALSAWIFKLSLDYLISQGRQIYDVGEQGISSLAAKPFDMLLFALDPRTYWSVFKLWTFPFPFHNTTVLETLTEKIASFILMLVWFGLLATSFWLEIKDKSNEVKREIIYKWLAVIFCFGLAATFIIADSPLQAIDHRPHLHLTFLGLVIFTSFYALEIVIPHFLFLQNKKIHFLAGFLVLMTAFGAQSGVLRNIVNVHKAQLDFIRTELLSQDINSYETIIVVLPVENQGCITEPCGPWIGERIENNGHLFHVEAYMYALSTLGVDPFEKDITFVEQKDFVQQEHSVTIDWGVFSLAQQMYAEGLSK